MEALTTAETTHWIDRLAQSECPALTARRARRAEMTGLPFDPIVWKRASGALVEDIDGNRFIDMCAGFGAASVGHGHPKVVEAVQRQSGELLHAMGDVYPSTVKIELLEMLCALSPWDDSRCMLGLNGSDAVEAALKTAVLHTGRPGVLAFKGAYHGLSYGALGVSAYQPAFRVPFDAQLNAHVRWVDYLDVDAVKNALESSNIGAVIFEPILGRGGFKPPGSGALRALSELCRSKGVVLIADEILTGLGRCGAYFQSIEDGCEPDIICLGKSLGGGLPISACIGRTHVMQSWAKDSNVGGETIHTATFFGNPVSAAAAKATLEVIRDEQLNARSQTVGERWLASLKADLQSFDFVTEVRGRGLMVGVELDRGERCFFAARKLLERGFIVLLAGRKANVLSLSPPLVIEEEKLVSFNGALVEVLNDVR